uniref:Uncharacterized protein n=1 Tax=Salvator merianae TaxID=96440 RepID=A0A8D0KPB5_SALMN
ITPFPMAGSQPASKSIKKQPGQELSLMLLLCIHMCLGRQSEQPEVLLQTLLTHMYSVYACTVLLTARLHGCPDSHPLLSYVDDMAGHVSGSFPSVHCIYESLRYKICVKFNTHLKINL